MNESRVGEQEGNSTRELVSTNLEIECVGWGVRSWCWCVLYDLLPSIIYIQVPMQPLQSFFVSLGGTRQ
jgi:hypothetical protein